MQSMSLSASQVQSSNNRGTGTSGSGSMSDEGDLKRNLYEKMKSAGVLNALKS